jgi:hypothetical protein
MIQSAESELPFAGLHGLLRPISHIPKGGGNALIAHGVISRHTQDVDLFTNDEAG